MRQDGMFGSDDWRLQQVPWLAGEHYTMAKSFLPSCNEF